MMRYTEYPSGAVLCCAPHDNGAIVVVCRDIDVPPIVRADRARQGVQEILDKLNTEAHSLPAS